MADSNERTPLLSSQNGSPLSSVTIDTVSGASHRGSNNTETKTVIKYGRSNHASHIAFARLPSIEQINPIALSWKDINVSVKLPTKKWNCCGNQETVELTKQVLTDVNGIVQPGDLLAIMGASGAGKSTLLNVLTRRNIKAYTVSGDIRLNGWSVDNDIKNVSAYVQQDDIFISTLTVREQLQFRALLRMDRRLIKSHRLARVEEVIVEMGLTKCANNRIGDAGGGKKGISGGERKRLSFASEALTNPPIFFCDEPTSGLDAFMAQNLMYTLQVMAERGRTILCTIHQPSSDLFSMFNKILLLSEGRTVYMGSTDGAMEFFKRQNYPCPLNYNPADHFIFTLAIMPGKEEECRRKTKALCDVFLTSDEAATIAAETEKLVTDARNKTFDPVLEEISAGESRYEASWFTQYRYLFWRSWISLFRDVFLFKVRIMQTLILGVVLGLIFLQLKIDQKGVMNINGAIFLLITNTSFSNMFAVVNAFPHELAVFLREYGSGLYRADVYYFTKTLTELPVFAVISVLFTTLTYWMIGLYASWEAYLIAVGVLVLIANVAVSFGYLISTLCGSVTVALAVAPPLLIPIMLFGGLFLNNADIPDYFVWMKFMSWFRYANEILIVNQWTNIGNITCQLPPIHANGTHVDSNCMFRTGQDVLNYVSFEKDNVNLDIGLLVALIAGFRLISLIILVVKARRSRE